MPIGPRRNFIHNALGCARWVRCPCIRFRRSGLAAQSGVGQLPLPVATVRPVGELQVSACQVCIYQRGCRLQAGSDCIGMARYLLQVVHAVSRARSYHTVPSSRWSIPKFQRHIPRHR